MVYAEEAFPVETHHRKDGAKLDDERERVYERVTLRHSQQVLGDDHVARRRNRKKLGQPFYDCDDDRLYDVHYSAFVSLGLRMTA